MKEGGSACAGREAKSKGKKGLDMVHLWVETDEGWGALELGDEPVVIDGQGEHGVRPLGQLRPPPEAALLRPCDGGKGWVLLADPATADVRVNGERLASGARVLEDRDGLLVNSRRLFFSTERLARIEPLPQTAGQPRCPRCQQDIATGHPAVRCPNPQCGARYHQSDELPCWTYARKCVVCGWPTEISDGYQWTPEGL